MYGQRDSIYLRTPCHILFLLRYIHESFLRFWLNANNSECFCLPTMLLEIIGRSYWLTGMKSASKVQRILEKRKLFGKIFSFPTDFSVFPWLIYKKKQDVCGKIIVWIGAVSLCQISRRLTFVHGASRQANGKTNHSEAINDKDKTSPP